MARSSVPKNDLGTPIQYDPDFNGPLRRRSCTDIICLGLFVVFIGCWIGVGLYAYANGNPETLLIPRDSNGSRCGYDVHVKDKPNLFFFDLTKCLAPSVPFTGCDTPQVCVEKCPEDTFLLDELLKFKGTTSNLNSIICVNGVAKPKSTKEAEKLVNENLCARWHLPSKAVSKRCIPLVNNVDYTIFQDVGLELITAANMNASIKNIELLEKMNQIGSDVIDDIKHSWQEIVGGLAMGIIFCIIYIALLRWIAAVMVWLSIAGIIALLSFCTYYCANNYKFYKENPYLHEKAKNILEEYVKSEKFWLVMLIIVSIVLGILLLVVVFLRKRIVLAIGLIKEGSKAVSATISTLFFPIVPWILHMAIIAYAISVALFLSSVGDPLYEIRDFDKRYCQCVGNASHYDNGVVCQISDYQNFCSGLGCNPDSCRFIKMNNPPIIPYVHGFNVFGFFWGVFFISALGEMILAATFATWYWTFNKKNVPYFTLTNATGRTLRYHIGTLAFGSLIIAICRMIRVALEYIDHKLKKYDNEITKAILCCLKCFFWCLEKFLKFINKNAYIMCAIHGKNFCTSAKDAFGLLIRNIIRVFVLDKVTDFLFFISKLVVTIGVACTAYSFIHYVSEKSLHYDYVPAIFVAICTYLVASVFFSVYTMAVDTLFLCFLEDCERNDGSAEKPYFMSKNLMKILNKKNK